MSTKPLSPPLIIAHTQIRRDPVGRYCLNDLHQASGGAKRHQPANWLRTDQAQALVAELQKPSKNEEGLLRYEEAPLEVVNDGFANGTYAVKELVYAYAMWISPRFHLEVIRAYDALVNSRSLGEATLPAYRATHALRARLVAMLGRAGSAAERHSEQPRFLGAKAVNSPLSRKTVKCWVFERGSDVT